jgi:hypothetical protein
VPADIENLREQAQHLSDCLERLRNSKDKFPNPKEARWMEKMMESSLIALDNHIRELDRLQYRDRVTHRMYRKKKGD